jgi:hypothetical protein
LVSSRGGVGGEEGLEGVDVGGGVFVEGWGVAQDAVQEFVGVDVEKASEG